VSLRGWPASTAWFVTASGRKKSVAAARSNSCSTHSWAGWFVRTCTGRRSTSAYHQTDRCAHACLLDARTSADADGCELAGHVDERVRGCDA
jgi:hypothetical protein